jgi:hypothetical protein
MKIESSLRIWKKCKFLSGKQLKKKSKWIKKWKFSSFRHVFWGLQKSFPNYFEILKLINKMAFQFFHFMPLFGLHILFNQKSTAINSQTSQTYLVQIPNYYAQRSKYFVLILIRYMLTCCYSILSKVLPTFHIKKID